LREARDAHNWVAWRDSLDPPLLDVLALALTIFYVKSSNLADAVTLPGIYFFTAAVVLTMIAHGWVKHGR